MTKNASPTEASVTLVRELGVLRVTITDDGVGGARIATGSGLAGLRDRLDALDATLAIESRPNKEQRSAQSSHASSDRRRRTAHSRRCDASADRKRRRSSRPGRRRRRAARMCPRPPTGRRARGRSNAADAHRRRTTRRARDPLTLFRDGRARPLATPRTGVRATPHRPKTGRAPGT